MSDGVGGRALEFALELACALDSIHAALATAAVRVEVDVLEGARVESVEGESMRRKLLQRVENRISLGKAFFGRELL